MKAREDVERLFMIDRLPPEAQPRYDAMNGPSVDVPLIKLAGPWDTKEFLIEELRSDVVHSILKIREKQEPLDPFTLVRVHQAMARLDVHLDAFLIHPDFEPLCGNMIQPFFGWHAKLFVHHEVPYAEIFGLCEPQYLGVVPVQNGRPGVLCFTDNIVWGRFRPRAGV